MLFNESNPGPGRAVWEDTSLRLAIGAAVVNVESPGHIQLDKHSVVSRSTVGKYFGIGCFSYVTNTDIGRYCTFGARVSVGAFSHPTNWLSIHEFQYRDTTDMYGDTVIEGGQNVAPKLPRTTIGNDVWIGDNVAVRFGVTIGDGAIIGLGSVVTKDVPPYAIAVGNPARVLRYRFEPDVIAQLLASRWWELDIPDMKGVDFSDVHSALAEIGRRKAALGKA